MLFDDEVLEKDPDENTINQLDKPT
jgi:hypothetical protein